MENNPRPITTSAMARRLGVSTQWLRTEAEAGRIPAIRAGSTHLFNPEAVERLLLERAAREEFAR